MGGPLFKPAPAPVLSLQRNAVRGRRAAPQKPEAPGGHVQTLEAFRGAGRPRADLPVRMPDRDGQQIGVVTKPLGKRVPLVAHAAQARGRGRAGGWVRAPHVRWARVVRGGETLCPTSMRACARARALDQGHLCRSPST